MVYYFAVQFHNLLPDKNEKYLKGGSGGGKNPASISFTATLAPADEERTATEQRGTLPLFCFVGCQSNHQMPNKCLNLYQNLVLNVGSEMPNALQIPVIHFSLDAQLTWTSMRALATTVVVICI